MRPFLSALLWGFVLIPPTLSSNLAQLVEALDQSSEAKTQIYFAIDTAELQIYNRIIEGSSSAKVIISQQVNFELRWYFPLPALSLVWLRQNMEAAAWQQLKMTLVKTLRRWQRTSMLFIAETSSLEAETWLPLFDWCWSNGFHRVLLTNHDATNLLTFDAFPRVSVKTTTQEEYLKLNDDWRDFKGYKIRVSAGHTPPTCRLQLENNGEWAYKGMTPEFVKLFAERHNATLQVVIQPKHQRANIYDCLRLLDEGQLDICADMSNRNETRYEISPPTSLLSSYLIVPYAQPLEKFRYFVVPFRCEVWLMIAVSIILITCTLSLIYWRQYGVWCFGKFLLEAICRMLFISYSQTPFKGCWKYLIPMLLFTCGWIISNYYLAILSSILTTEVYDRQIDSLEDLHTYNISVVTAKDHIPVLKWFGLRPQVFEHLSTREVSESRRLRRNLDPRFAYIGITSSLSSYYLYQQKFLLRPRMKLLDVPIMALWVGLPFRETWPVKHLFKAHTRRLFETGLSGFFLENDWQESIRMGEISFFKTEYYEVQPLNMHYFEMPAILLGVGFSLAIVTFLVECVMGYGLNF